MSSRQFWLSGALQWLIQSGIQLCRTGARQRIYAFILAVLESDSFDPHSQCDWTINEPQAKKDGLELSVIDVVSGHKPTTGFNEKDASLIKFGGELFPKHLSRSQPMHVS